MDKASDIFFLDVESLRSLRNSQAHPPRFSHSAIAPKKLVAQAPLIEDLEEIVEQERGHPSPLQTGSKAVAIKSELSSAKMSARVQVRKMQRLERDLAKAEFLEKALVSEVHKTQAMGSSAQRSPPPSLKHSSAKNREIVAIAKAVGMKVRDASEMYAKVHRHGNFEGAENYEFGMDDFVSKIFDKIKSKPSEARAVLAENHRHITRHDVERLMKLASSSARGGGGGGGTAAAAARTEEPPKADKILRGLVVMRRLHLLAQIEGGLGRDAETEDDEESTTAPNAYATKLSLAKSFSSTTTSHTRVSLPPVKIAVNSALSTSAAPKAASPSPSMPNGQYPTLIDGLRNELESSSKTLHDLDRAMKRDVALVSQNYAIKSQNARKMSFVWGLEKLEFVGATMIRKYLWISFRRMLRYDKYRQNCINAVQFVKTLNARIIGRVLVKWLEYKFASMFQDWKQRSVHETQLEEHSAALEMQAAFRMKIAIDRTQVLRERRAATNIQRIHRGNDGRKLARARREYLRRKWAVSVIENSWISLQVIRGARRVVRVKKENFAASVVQRRWRIRQAGRRVHLMKELRKKEMNCLMIQCLYRGYRTRCRIYHSLKEKEKSAAATVIQSLVRGFLAYWNVEDLRERHAAATSIQTVFRGSDSKRKVQIVLRNKAATEIQRICRGILHREMIARRRRWIAAQFSREARCTIKIQNAFRKRAAVRKASERKEARLKMLQMENERATVLQKVARGRKSRADFKKRLERKKKEAEVQGEQRRASICIQAQFRRKRASQVASTERLKRDQEYRAENATRLQSLFRGKRGRMRSTLARQQHERMMEEKRYGLYHALQRRYLREQNEKHGAHASIIQANARIFLSKCRVSKLRGDKQHAMEKEQMNHAALLIQNKSRSRNAKIELGKRKEAKAERERREREDDERRAVREEAEKFEAATLLQRRQRGRQGRQHFAVMKEKKVQAESATKLQAAVRGRRAKKDVGKKRIEKLESERQEMALNRERNECATRLQALHRGNVCRADKEGYVDGLKVEKEKRDALRLAMAVVKMQCGWRKNRARKKFRKRQKIAEEEKKQAEEELEIERNLEMLHKEQELLLYVLRLQNCYRNKKARQKFDFARIAKMELGKVRKENQRKKSILKVQSWARGISVREWWKKNVGRLREELEYRSWCVECMSKLATRRCTTCLDRYCSDCWDIIHRNGRKRQHAWDVIDLRKVAGDGFFATNGFKDGESFGFFKNNDLKDGNGSAAGQQQEWTEFYDESAGANYWYNEKTGEARWTKP